MNAHAMKALFYVGLFLLAFMVLFELLFMLVDKITSDQDARAGWVHPYTNVRVIDGDTISFEGERYRIRALAAPEVHTPEGRNARYVLISLVMDHQGILGCDVTGEITWERYEADCAFGDGADVARLMITAGAARHCPKYGRPDLAALSRVENKSLPLPEYCL